MRQAGQISTTPQAPRVFADSLLPSDEVATEATGNTHALAKVSAPRIATVMIFNPMKTRAIAEAKVKTERSRESPGAAAAGGLPPGGVNG